MEAVLYWQCTAVIYVLLQKMARVLEVFFFVSKHGRKWFTAFHRLKYLCVVFVLVSLSRTYLHTQKEFLHILLLSLLISPGVMEPCVRI